MAAPDDQKMLDNFGYESLDVGGDVPSVNFLTFMLLLLADLSVPLVPTFICSQRQSVHMPKKCS